MQLENNPNEDAKGEYYQCKEELALIEENKAKGSVVRSKVKWLEYGENSTLYFFDWKSITRLRNMYDKLLFVIMRLSLRVVRY